MDPIFDHDALRAHVRYDPETGIFTWLVSSGRHGHHKPGEIIGGMNTAGYLVGGVMGKRVYMHRLAVFYMTGEWPSFDVDHKDCDRSNNKWANLRCVHRSLNTQNRRKSRADRIHGNLLGVKKHRKKWQARIAVEGVDMFLGSFATELEAHAAYVNAKRQLHKGCTL